MLNKYIILIVLIVIFINIIHKLSKYKQYKYNINNNIISFKTYSYYSCIKNITNITDIFLTLNNITYSYNKENKMIEIKYFIGLKDKKNELIRPSDLFLVYNLHLLCDIYIVENKENIYSISNI